MRYTLKNQKTVTIPDKEIENLMAKLELSENEAIETWLSDNGYEEDETVNELTKKAKKNINVYTTGENFQKKEKKAHPVKSTDEKIALFAEIYGFLSEKYGENCEIVIQNKRLVVNFGNDRPITVDLVQKRAGK